MGCGGSSAKIAGDQDCAAPGSHSGPWICGKPPLFSISTPIWASQSRAVLTLPKAEEGRLAPVRLKRDRPPDLHLSTQYLALCRSLAGFDFLGHDGQKGLPVLLGQPGFRMWKARGRRGGRRGSAGVDDLGIRSTGPERASMAAVDACPVIRCLPNPVLLI